MQPFTSAEQLQIFRSSRELLRGHFTRGEELGAWEKFAQDLQENGICEKKVQGLVAALHHHLASALLSPRIRILHPVEEEVLSTEAWGLLIETISLGMIENQNAEEILEQVAQKGRLPIGRDHLEYGLASRWHGMLTAGSPSGFLPS